MFRRRKNLNDIFGDFDEIFSQFDSMFSNLSNGGKFEKGTDDLGEWKEESYTSPDGKVSFKTYVRTNSSHGSNKTSGLNALKAKLQIAIDEENFEEAVKLRDEIKKYESNQDEIKKLESELQQSIKEQNFEKSIQIRDELKKLKS
jgi:protein-arginine kinase activator protein McsA